MDLDQLDNRSAKCWSLFHNRDFTSPPINKQQNWQEFLCTTLYPGSCFPPHITIAIASCGGETVDRIAAAPPLGEEILQGGATYPRTTGKEYGKVRGSD